MQYDHYNEDTFYKPGLAVQVRERLHRIVFKGLKFKNILEVGIGFGEMARYCEKFGIGWTGVDANQQLIDKLKADGKQVHYAEMPTFPEIPEEVDMVFAAHFIEHLKDFKEALLFLERSRDLLKAKGGKYMVLLYPDIEKAGPIFWHDYSHSFVTTKKRVETLLFDTGFKVTRSGRYTACFFATSGLVSFIGKIFPYFLLPPKIALFAKLSFQQHAFTIAEV